MPGPKQTLQTWLHNHPLRIQILPELQRKNFPQPSISQVPQHRFWQIVGMCKKYYKQYFFICLKYLGICSKGRHFKASSSFLANAIPTLICTLPPSVCHCGSSFSFMWHCTVKLLSHWPCILASETVCMTDCFLFGYTFLNIIVISGPDYIRQKYNKPEEVHDVPVELNKEKSPAGSPHFYRKGTTPTQSPTQSPSSSPTASPSSTRWNFNKKAPVGKEANTSTGESLKPLKSPYVLMTACLFFF